MGHIEGRKVTVELSEDEARELISLLDIARGFNKKLHGALMRSLEYSAPMTENRYVAMRSAIKAAENWSA